MGISYTPSVVPGLSTMVSVYNILNRHGVTNVDEYNTDSQDTVLSSYRAPYSYQPPRYVQLSARYDFSFRR
jgi:outer membrane receptor protein involved in Fe transport